MKTCQALSWIAFLLMTSCSAANPSASNLKAEETKENPLYKEVYFELPTAECGEGQSPYSYSLVGDALPEIEGREKGSSSYLGGTRLDFCYNDDDGSLRLLQVVKPVGQGGLGMLIFGIWTIDSSKEQAGVVEALTDGDYTKLNVVDDHVSLTGESLDGLNFAVLQLGEKVIYGEIFDYDVLKNEKKQHNRVVSLGDVRIELNYKMSGQVGMYVSYIFESIHLVDKTPSLKAPIDVTLSGPELTKAIFLNNSHHGLTDTITITLADGLKYEIGARKLVTPSGTFPLDCTSLPNCGVDPALDPTVPQPM